MVNLTKLTVQILVLDNKTISEKWIWKDVEWRSRLPGGTEKTTENVS
jgi:hypothetical protein